jgi:hypothetical protein
MPCRDSHARSNRVSMGSWMPSVSFFVLDSRLLFGSRRRRCSEQPGSSALRPQGMVSTTPRPGQTHPCRTSTASPRSTYSLGTPLTCAVSRGRGDVAAQPQGAGGGSRAVCSRPAVAPAHAVRRGTQPAIPPECVAAAVITSSSSQVHCSFVAAKLSKGPPRGLVAILLPL